LLVLVVADDDKRVELCVLELLRNLLDARRALLDPLCITSSLSWSLIEGCVGRRFAMGRGTAELVEQAGRFASISACFG
jgi:hypothetical protein